MNFYIQCFQDSLMKLGFLISGKFDIFTLSFKKTLKNYSKFIEENYQISNLRKEMSEPKIALLRYFSMLKKTFFVSF